MRVGKAALDQVLPPVITGSVAVVIGIALAGAALSRPAHIGHCFRHSDRHGRLLGVPAGQGPDGHAADPDGRFRRLPGRVPDGPGQVRAVGEAAWIARSPHHLAGIYRSQRLGAVAGIALIAIATIPESTAHLYQMSLYIDQLAKEMGREPLEIKKLIGLNLVADGSR